MIKVVAFDLDGTLIDFPIKEFIKAYLKSRYAFIIMILEMHKIHQTLYRDSGP